MKVKKFGELSNDEDFKKKDNGISYRHRRNAELEKKGRKGVGVTYVKMSC